MTIANRQGETQLPLVSLVLFAAEEAGAQKVQLGFTHGTFKAEDQPVVKIVQVINMSTTIVSNKRTVPITVVNLPTSENFQAENGSHLT